VQELWKEAVEERERSAAASCGSEPRRRRVASVGVGAKSAWRQKDPEPVSHAPGSVRGIHAVNGRAGRLKWRVAQAVQ
jgi:hypothetical protein